MRTMINRGLSLESVSQPRFTDSRKPGRKFSMTMSAALISSRAICCARGYFRFNVTDFLLRLSEYHQYEVPLCNLRQPRSGSPPEDSIFTTSAPNCANTDAAYGAAINPPNSTTFTPLSAASAIAHSSSDQPAFLKSSSPSPCHPKRPAVRPPSMEMV